MTTTDLEPVNFFRRLGAMFYDGLLIGSTALLLGGIIGTVLSHVLGLGEIPPHSVIARLLFLFEIMLAGALFSWFCTHGGQTLGMRAWKIRVVNEQGGSISWRQAIIRYIGALFSWIALGAGYLIALFDPEKRTWHDRWSRTRIVSVVSTVSA